MLLEARQGSRAVYEAVASPDRLRAVGRVSTRSSAWEGGHRGFEAVFIRNQGVRLVILATHLVLLALLLAPSIPLVRSGCRLEVYMHKGVTMPNLNLRKILNKWKWSENSKPLCISLCFQFLSPFLAQKSGFKKLFWNGIQWRS